MDVVDENDNVIGKATRMEIHSSEMWHRGVHIFVFNSKGELLLPLRSSKKDKFPNTYDCSVSEHVNSGETFQDAALRGLKEELKIEKPKLRKLLKFKMNYGPHDNMISVLFECYYDEKIEADKDEIEKVEFLPLKIVKEMLKTDELKFAPWTRELLRWYFHLPTKIQEIR